MNYYLNIMHFVEIYPTYVGLVLKIFLPYARIYFKKKSILILGYEKLNIFQPLK